MRAMTRGPRTPAAAQAAWRRRSTTTSRSRRGPTTDVAESTITRPSRLSTATRNASARYRPDGAGRWRARGPARSGAARGTASRRRPRCCVTPGAACIVTRLAHRRRPVGDGAAAAQSRTPAEIVGVEEAERHRHGQGGEDPEADDHGGLGPAGQLEVVVDRRHAEDPPAGQPEAAHLDDHRQRLEHEQAADDRAAAADVERERPGRPGPAPMASEPVSPMKIRAGGAFHHRNPVQPPSMAAATTARSRAWLIS